MFSKPLSQLFLCRPLIYTYLHRFPVISDWSLLMESLSSDIPAVQVNIELLTIDKRSFTTDEGNSLLTLFGENSEGSAQYRAEVTLIASRLATVFASLKV